MKLHTLLYDFTDIIGAVPEMDAIRLIPTSDGLQFFGISEATSKNSKLVLEGQTVEPIEGIKNPFGIPSLQHISKIFKAPKFNRLTASADLKKFAWESEFQHLALSNEDGASYNISVHGEELSKERIKVAKLKQNVNYQISTTPTQDSVNLIKYWLKIARQNGESNVELTPITRDGKLLFKTKAGSIFDVEYVVDGNVNGILNKPCVYNGRTLFRLMSLAQCAKHATLLFSDLGLCRIDIETSCAKYTFLIPAVAY